jgi:hypothetical protein
MLARRAGDPCLKHHVATFHGRACVEDVIDMEGKSIKELFLLDCCYGLEILTGDETKTASKLTLSEIENFAHVKDAADKFRELGISVSDSSVFDAGDPGRFKFIDFELPYY